MTGTIAVYGGSFDPPHVAHVLVACWARSSGDVDRVIVVPTWRHAFEKRSAPYEDRVTMCEMAMAPLEGVEVSRIEREIQESRTLHVLEALQEAEPEARLRLVIGTDILPSTPKWHRWDAVAALAPPLLVGRRGYPADEATLAAHGLHEPPLTMPELSSTEMRRRLGSGESVEGRVPPAVAEYARARKLYQGPSR
jgi:nicotinate-nucleotide adenylyltransferase